MNGEARTLELATDLQLKLMGGNQAVALQQMFERRQALQVFLQIEQTETRKGMYSKACSKPDTPVYSQTNQKQLLSRKLMYATVCQGGRFGLLSCRMNSNSTS